MGFEVSDIEDMCKDAIPRSGQQISMVRIRKVNKGVSGDLCNSYCKANQTSHDCGRNQITHEVAETRQRDPSLVVASNDLNPEDYTVYLKTWGCSHNNSDSEYMAGLLAKHGFNISCRYDEAAVVILNSCTVKGPSEQHFKNEIDRSIKGKKHVVLAGCVVQSDRSYRSVASVIGVQQIDKIVEVVEETIKGHKVSFISAKRHGKRSPGAELALPKIRKNELIEIVPISTGCLNNCTYCKTKHARGQLASYSIDSIVSRIRNVCEYDKVVEIWLTSEDLGAWGIDLGHTIPELLNSIVNVLPKKCMLRLGMSNPPYMLDHLDEISRILSHPNVYEFLHIPVQSGSDSVLLEMKREYSISDFQKICDFMLKRHPNITIATDIICGYPTETDEDFKLTYELVNKYKFPVLFINQFYPRPGTVAAKLKRIPTHIVKARTRQLNELFLSYTNIHKSVLGTTQTVLVTDIAHDKVKFLAHNKFYQQVLIDHGEPNIMGQWVNVKIVSFGKFSMVAQTVYSPTTWSQILFTIIIFTCYILFYLK